MPAPVPAPVTTVSGIRRATIARFTCTFPRSISAFITTTSRSPSSQTTLRTFGTLFSLDMRHGCHRTPILAASPSLPPPISSTTATLLPGRHFLRPDAVFASLRLHPPLPRSLHRRRFRHQRMQRGHAIRFQLFRPLHRGGSRHRAGDDRHRRHRAHRGDYCAGMSAE